MKLLAAGLLAVSMFGQTAPESPVVGVGPFLHIISDLDESLKFYHDALGLELRGPPGEHPFTNNPAVANLYGVPGKQFRAGVLMIPGSPMGIELVQWGEAREPENKGTANPGAVTLILRVTDANAIVARAVKAKLSMMRSNGGPPTLHDPDGFAVQVLQSDNPGADLSVGVGDVSKTLELYRGTLGFNADSATLTVPGTSVKIRFYSVGDKAGLTVPFPAPGRGMLRLPTRNVAAVTESLKGAGFSVITTGGLPVTLPQGPQVVILRDPNNFYLQLMEAPASK